MRRVPFRARFARALAAVAVLTVLPLVAQGQATRDLAGTYAFEVLSPNGAVKVTMTVKKDAAAYAGTIDAEGFPQIQLVRVTPNDSGALFEAEPPDGSSVSIATRIMPDNKIMGKLNYSGMEMPFAGVYTPANGAVVGGGAMSGAAAFDPVGEYRGATTDPFMGTSSLPFMCVISKDAKGGYGGGCAPEGSSPHEAPFESVTVAGKVITAKGSSPMGMYSLQMAVDGASVTGEIALGAERAQLKATFVPAKK
ncbi:MAG: hypothetical protein MUF21_09225 [Gemmatimonadaceae bacterium]|nr:hypothetical protein [Gemmatimonadaceae bacterium]